MLQDVSTALGKFLVKCLPTDLHRSEGMSLLKELCSLSSSILTNANGSNVALQPVAEFATKLVSVHGKAVEQRAIEIINQSGDTGNSDEDEAGKLLEGLVLSLVEASAQSVLGVAASGKHQGQGQQPFESKEQPEPEKKTPTSLEGLSGIFSVLTACIRECPTFLIHLKVPASKTSHHESLLVARAIDSASAALTEMDVETVASSLEFLASAVSFLAIRC